MSNTVNLQLVRVKQDLARKFRDAAAALDRDREALFALLDVKFFLLAALNDVDRALNYGTPGLGLESLIGDKHD